MSRVASSMDRWRENTLRKKRVSAGTNVEVAVPRTTAKFLLIRLADRLDLLVLLDHAGVIVEPDPPVLREDDVPEVEDLLHLKAGVDVRDYFLDQGNRSPLAWSS